jgi:transglutaminase-like putative cysteine protease
MTAVDVPAFQTEDHMPPEHELRYRVNFVYSEDGFESDPDHFWKKYDKKQNEQTEKFMDRRNSMQEKVSQIILPADSKLRKIYARCQQVTNLSFERGDSVVRQKFKPNENVDDVWKNGVGTGRDINLLFLALTRAAGFEAYYVRLAGRSEYFFKPQRVNAAELDADAGW